MSDFQNVLLFAVGFSIIAVAAERIGRVFTRLHLPLITGYLLTGMLAGPYVLDLITVQATSRLGFIDETALGFIALAAGGELYLRELRNRLKSIAWLTGGLVVVTFVLVSVTVYLLAGMVPFLASFDHVGRIAVAILTGAVLVARSPSSAIAIVKELRARGPFTNTVLGVTVISDVVVIVAFAGAIAVAEALLTSAAFNFGFLGLLVAELAASLAAGILLGHLLGWIIGRKIPMRLKSLLLLGSGYSVFYLSRQVGHLGENLLGHEFLLEPLFTCMVAGFVVTNRTSYRNEFAKLLHNTELPVYVVFFTLTGASLALDVLTKTWLLALILFGVRLVSIMIGASGAGALAGAPARHNRISWLTYVTQAGVGLGLAKEVAATFPGWGESLGTVMVAVIVLNQLVGPPMFKWALRRSGETHTRLESGDGRTRLALVFGLEGEALALARQLREHDWKVRIASRRAHRRRAELDASELDIAQLAGLTPEALKEVGADQARAAVCLLSDEDNLKLCEILYEHMGTENIIVRLHDREYLEKFHELGVMIVDTGTAMVSLLDHCVRSPAATSLLLGLDPQEDVVDIMMRNRELHRTALRDLRLPLDVLVLYVRRGDRLFHSQGFTRLEIGDRVTVVGSDESLDEVRLRFGA